MHKIKPENHPNPICAWVMSRIRSIRLSRGMRVMDVAQKAGIPVGSYSCLETGRYRINLEHLFRLLQALGVDISDVWPYGGKASNGTVREADLKEAVRLAGQGQAEPISHLDIVEMISSQYGATEEELRSTSRRRNLAEARSVATILVKEEPHLTLVAFAALLNRDVSSLSHNMRRVNERLAYDRALRRQIELARQALQRLKKERGL